MLQFLTAFQTFALKHERTALLGLIAYFLYDLAYLYLSLTLGS